MILAFKHKPKTKFGKLLATLISWRTNSKYYHVEAIIDNKWISSGLTSGVEINECKPLYNESFDYFELKTPKLNKAQEKIFWEWLKEQEGSGYDWRGILLSQTIKLNWHSTNKWFCSELVNKMLQLHFVKETFGVSSNTVSPGDLFNILEPQLTKIEIQKKESK